MIIDLVMEKDLVGVHHQQNHQLPLMVVDGAPLVVGVIMIQKMVVGVRM